MPETIKKSILKKVYPKRPNNSHKGDYGRLLIIGGSDHYSGAPALNALAAMASLRSGVDIVEVAAPHRAADIIATCSPNLITIPLKGIYLNKENLNPLLTTSKNKDAFVIGSGLGKHKDSLLTAKKFLNKTHLPGVIDADAIHTINSKMRLNDFVITPHEREFEVLTKQKPKENLNQRIKQVTSAAKKLKTTILLKGNPDIISNGTKTSINKTGTPYMTVGGTGDVLAGILGSLIAQGNDNFTSACAAAYINGKAAELTKRKSSLVATDLIDKISSIIE